MVDLQGAASPSEMEETLPDRNAEEMAKWFYLVKSVLRHCYCQGWLLGEVSTSPLLLSGLALPYPLGRVWRG